MNIRNLLKVSVLFSMLLIANYLFAQTTTTADSTITADVNSRLSAESALSGTQIKTTTSNGIVSLSGNVNSSAQATTATQIAQSTQGVIDVNTSQLTVKGGNQPVTDAFITAKIKGLFLQQKLFGNTDIAAVSIRVETNNGNVALTGTADNQQQIDTAIRLARSVSGVTNVKSNVQVVNPNTTTTAH